MSIVVAQSGKIFFYAFSFILFGCALCSREIGILWQNHQLEKSGLLADARIVERSSGKQGDELYEPSFVMLNFVPESGKRLNTVVNVSDDFLHAHAAPSLTHVKVRYLRADPAVASIVGEPRGWAKTGTGLLMIIAGLAAIGVGLWIIRLEANG